MRERNGTKDNPLPVFTPPAKGSSGRRANAKLLGFSSLGRPVNTLLLSDDEEEGGALDLEADAEKFFASCPLKSYRQGTWTRTMPKLLESVLQVKKVVQTWDIILMNQAKRHLVHHLHACDSRISGELESENPIQLTKRYVGMLRRFVAKHRHGASSPKKLPAKRGRSSRLLALEVRKLRFRVRLRSHPALAI
jgi:hypothetical protein